MPKQQAERIIDRRRPTGSSGSYSAPDGRYVRLVDYEDGDVLAKLLNVDGALSGLDADLLDGQQIEGETMAKKLETAKAIVAAVQSLSTATDSAADLEAEFFDVGTFTDEDVAPLGITAAQLASCITLLQQVNKLMSGQATTPAIYRTTLNAVRRVQANG